jgi:hypothetical protein
MKPRLAFIPRAYRPVVERAREMFDVAYEDRQQERRHCFRRGEGIDHLNLRRRIGR